MARDKKVAGCQPSGLPAHNISSVLPEVLADQLAAHNYPDKDRFPGPMVWHVLCKHAKLKKNTKIALMLTLVQGLPAGYVADQCGLAFTSMDTLLTKYRKEVRAAIAAGEVPVTNTDTILQDILANPDNYRHMVHVIWASEEDYQNNKPCWVSPRAAGKE